MKQEELDQFLLDSRKSFRNLFIYTERIKDTMKYIDSILLNYGYTTSYSRYCGVVKENNSCDIDFKAWSWLPMYLYEFYFGEYNEVKFSIFVVSDSGFFDRELTNKIGSNVDEFEDASSSVSKIVFCVGRNDWHGVDFYVNEFQRVFSSNVDEFVRKESETKFLYARAYNLSSFTDVESIRKNLEDFNSKCKKLRIEGVELKTEFE